MEDEPATADEAHGLLALDWDEAALTHGKHLLRAVKRDDPALFLESLQAIQLCIHMQGIKTVFEEGDDDAR